MTTDIDVRDKIQSAIQEAWLLLLTGKPEEAERAYKAVARAQEWEKFVKRYIYWINNECPIETLRFMQFPEKDIERLRNWVMKNSPWRPPTETPTPPPAASLPQAQVPDFWIKGSELMTALKGAKNSIVVVASPGSGKTTTVKEWILGQLRQNPNGVLLRVVGMKNYSFFGLDKIAGCVSVLRTFENRILHNPLIEALTWLDNILEQRRQAPEGTDFSNEPAWLVITDYTPIFNDLQKLHKEKADWVASMVYRICTVGREYYVGLLLDMHSFNIAALGFGDSNSRGAFTLLALGFEHDSDSGKEGNYNAISNLFNNPYLCPKARECKAIFPKAVSFSKTNQLPLFYATIADGRMGLMPNLRHIKTMDELPEAFLNSLKQRLEKSYKSKTGVSPFEPPIELIERMEQDEQSNPFDNSGIEEDASEQAYPELTWLEWAQRSNEALARACACLAKEKNQTYVIKEVLKCNGRNYQFGKMWLEKLLAIAAQN
ncbi:MAG TPA: hypothetical protein V6C65_04555 [Allocoleopsis sp.]